MKRDCSQKDQAITRAYYAFLDCLYEQLRTKRLKLARKEVLFSTRTMHHPFIFPNLGMRLGKYYYEIRRSSLLSKGIAVAKYLKDLAPPFSTQILLCNCDFPTWFSHH